MDTHPSELYVSVWKSWRHQTTVFLCICVAAKKTHKRAYSRTELRSTLVSGMKSRSVGFLSRHYTSDWCSSCFVFAQKLENVDRQFLSRSAMLLFPCRRYLYLQRNYITHYLAHDGAAFCATMSTLMPYNVRTSMPWAVRLQRACVRACEWERQTSQPIPNNKTTFVNFDSVLPLCMGIMYLSVSNLCPNDFQVIDHLARYGFDAPIIKHL